MNPWLFSYLISLILLAVLVNWKRLPINIFSGIISAVYMFADCFLGNRLDLFKYHNVNLNLPKSIFFSDSVNIFVVGIAFNVGIIYFQFLPRKLSFQLIFALILTLFFLLFNYIIKEYNLVTFIHFRAYFVIRLLLFFLTLAWFKTFFLKKYLNVNEVVS